MRHKYTRYRLEKRKQEIIEYVKGSPLCTKDSIFTKGRIPKSKVTIKLIDKLVSQKILLAKQNPKGKTAYCVKNMLPNIKEKIKRRVKGDYVEFLKWFAIIAGNGNFLHRPDLTAKFVKFLRTRAKVLEREKRLSGKINTTDTNRIIMQVLGFMKNPTDEDAIRLMIILSLPINYDEYYLKHQLHSTPRENEYPFQKSKKRHLRRSMTELLSMKEKGRHEFSLSKRDYEEHIGKLKDDKGNYDSTKWLDRCLAERDRVLYHNLPKLQTEICKEMISKEFIPRTEREKRIKLFFDEYRKTYPKIPVKVLLECLDNKAIESLKKEYKGITSDFETIKSAIIKYYDSVNQSISRFSPVSP